MFFAFYGFKYQLVLSCELLLEIFNVYLIRPFV